MKILTENRSLALILFTASTLVGVAGCTAARKTSTPSASSAEEPPKKEYQWKDLSTGQSFFQNSKPTPAN